MTPWHIYDQELSIPYSFWKFWQVDISRFSKSKNNSTGRFEISRKNHRNHPRGKSEKIFLKAKYFFQKTINFLEKIWVLLRQKNGCWEIYFWKILADGCADFFRWFQICVQNFVFYLESLEKMDFSIKTILGGVRMRRVDPRANLGISQCWNRNLPRIWDRCTWV